MVLAWGVGTDVPGVHAWRRRKARGHLGLARAQDEQSNTMIQEEPPVVPAVLLADSVGYGGCLYGEALREFESVHSANVWFPQLLAAAHGKGGSEL